MLHFVGYWNLFYAIGTGLLPALRQAPELKPGPLAFVGRHSLCIYLFHIHFLNLARLVTLKISPEGVWFNVVIGTAIALAGPLLLYRVLEKQNWFRRSIGEKPLALPASTRA